MKYLLSAFIMGLAFSVSAQRVAFDDYKGTARVYNNTGFGYNKDYVFFDKGRAFYELLVKADEWVLNNQEEKGSFQKDLGTIKGFEGGLYDSGITQAFDITALFIGNKDGSFMIVFETKTLLGKKEWFRITNLMDLQKLMMALEGPSE